MRAGARRRLHQHGQDELQHQTLRDAQFGMQTAKAAVFQLDWEQILAQRLPIVFSELRLLKMSHLLLSSAAIQATPALVVDATYAAQCPH